MTLQPVEFIALLVKYSHKGYYLWIYFFGIKKNQILVNKIDSGG